MPARAAGHDSLAGIDLLDVMMIHDQRLRPASRDRRGALRWETIVPAAARLVVGAGLLLGAMGQAMALEPGSAPADRPDDAPDLRIPFPVIRAAGALERRGKPVLLAGVVVTQPAETCGDDADRWPCGQMALTAIRRFVRTRTIECAFVPAEGGDAQGAKCSVAGEDIGQWLVSQGWARSDGSDYGEAEEEARKARLGVWSPTRPGIAKQALAGAISEAEAAEAAVRVEVNLSSQQLTLIHRGTVVANWPVSTARAGKITPTGRWRAQWLSRHHRSSLYNGAPMPYSVFFNGDYAIHGTNEIGRLGRPASAGCIRLHPSHAAVVFDLARREGLENTLVVVRR